MAQTPAPTLCTHLFSSATARPLCLFSALSCSFWLRLASSATTFIVVLMLFLAVAVVSISVFRDVVVVSIAIMMIIDVGAVLIATLSILLSDSSPPGDP